MTGTTLALAMMLALVLSGVQTRGQSRSVANAAAPSNTTTDDKTAATADTQEGCYGCSALKEVRCVGLAAQLL